MSTTMASQASPAWTSAEGIVLRDLVPRGLRESWVSRGLCPGRDLYSLFREHVRAAPGRDAVVDEEGVLGYAELDERVRRAAAALAAAGHGPADVIGILLPNGRDLVVAELAVAAIGAVALPIPPAYGDRDVASLLGRARAAALVTTPEAVRTGRFAGPYPRGLWVPGSAVEGARGLEGATAAQVRDWRPATPGSGAPARILISSGSEAEPKMVAYSHDAMAGGRGNYLAALRLGSGPMRNLVLVSLASSYGSLGMVTLARHGGTLVLLRRFDPAAALRAIERHRPTHVFGVPTMLRRIAECADLGESAAEGHGPGRVGERHDGYGQACRTFPGLRALVSSGGPLQEPVRDACVRRFGVPVINVYGSSDGVNCHTGHDPDAWRPGLAGRPDPDVAEVSVRDGDGRPAPPGAAGEIWARGPMTPLCYVAAPELDRRYRAEGGWVRTGDLGRLDPDGTLWVLDRLRRVVIRGGLTLSPAEVERELATHPGVADVCCVPVPDPDLGERMCACVAPVDPGRAPSPAALTGYLRDERGLSPRKLPERYLLLPELPLGPTGKTCAATLARLAARAVLADAAGHPVRPTVPTKE